MGKFKTPDVKTSGKIAKPGQAIKDPSFLLRPCFSFQHLQKGRFHLTACDDEAKICLIERLVKLSELSWTQIYSSKIHGFGAEKLHIKQLSAAMPSGITDEVELTAIRFSGKNQPMVGFRTGNVFHILFLDPGFSLYSHG